MRQKLYYTKPEIQNNLHTAGKEWMLSDGTEYKGLYHRYLTGEVYTRSEWDASLSKPLVPYIASTQQNVYKRLKPDIKTRYVTPSPYHITVTESDIKAGFITRYLLQRINTKQIIEVTESDYIKWQSREIDPNIYNGITVKWRITGELYSYRLNGALILGVIDDNNRQIAAAKRQMPQIELYLLNPIEFYIDDNITIPPDIN